jgi:hypothetical protein
VLPLLRREGRRRRAGLLHRAAGRRRGPARCGGVGNGEMRGEWRCGLWLGRRGLVPISVGLVQLTTYWASGLGKIRTP